MKMNCLSVRNERQLGIDKSIQSLYFDVWSCDMHLKNIKTRVICTKMHHFQWKKSKKNSAEGVPFPDLPGRWGGDTLPWLHPFLAFGHSILVRTATSFYRAACNADAVYRWDFCLSVRPSVRLSNACIVTKRKKNLSTFLYHAKDHLSTFMRRRMVGGGRPLLSEILGQPARVGAKSPIFNQ